MIQVIAGLVVGIYALGMVAVLSGAVIGCVREGIKRLLKRS